LTEERQKSARQAALDYHEFPKPGKLEIRATKPLANVTSSLSLSYGFLFYCFFYLRLS